MNHLLQPRIWPSFRASSGVAPCDVPFRYASDPTPRGCPVARPPRLARMAGRHTHLHGLATGIHETSGLAEETGFLFFDIRNY